MRTNGYVLVSACRNEQDYIDGLVETIEKQTIPPNSWVIVDDGSTDRMASRVLEHAKRLPFLRLEQMPKGRPRSFSSQVYAAQHGYSVIKDAEYEFIGFLDADIRLEPAYYEKLIGRFESDRQLGLAGGLVLDQRAGVIDDLRRGSEDFHVAGGVQFFRRACFEQIGGYIAIDGGGQDTIADVMAMMNGWRIRSFGDLPAMHLRPDGFAKDNVLRHGMKWGRKFYLLGYHPLFYLAQCMRRLGRQPIVIGSFCQLLGFWAATLKGEPRPVSKDFIEFLRRSQMQRLRETFGSRGTRTQPVT